MLRLTPLAFLALGAALVLAPAAMALPSLAEPPALPGARVCDPVLSGLVGYCTTACDQVRRATGLGAVCPTT